MLKNYLTVALRNLWRNKIYSIINLMGLAIGLASCILIFLFVKDELSYDRFHANADRIFRVGITYKQGDYDMGMAIGPYRLAPALKAEEFPAVESIVRLGPTNLLVEYEEHQFNESNVFFGDDNLFEVFTFEFKKGNPETALTEPYTCVITQRTARKYFGDQEPLGKILRFNDEYSVKVTGVIKELPPNSHFHADILISMSTGDEVFPSIVLENWGEGSQYTYLLLSGNTNYKELEAMFPEFLVKTLGEEYAPHVSFSLQPMTDIHLHSKLDHEPEPVSDIAYLYIFSTVALIILLIASINYMNLATSRAVDRAKEVGMRKVVGANKSSLIIQFLGESILLTLFSLILAMVLAQLFLPVFNHLTDKDLSIDFYGNLGMIAVLVVLAILVGFIAGGYPAFFLSRFQPAVVLKGSLVKISGKTANLRKGLVILQFVISLTLLISTLIIYSQLNFLRNKKLGIKTQNMIILPLSDATRRQYEIFKNELLTNAKITNVTASNKRMTRRLSSVLDFRVEGDDESTAGPGGGMRIVTVDHDFFKTFDVEIVAGRDFSKDFLTDSKEAVILNESAAKIHGGIEAVGKSYRSETLNENNEWMEKKGRIIGIARDFNFESLHSTIEPVAFFISPIWINWVSIEVKGENLTETIAYVHKTWEKFDSKTPFEYTFLNEDIDQLYGAEERFLNLFTNFASLAMIIACLGVFGLASFTVVSRTKEIGIRKVLGASVRSITILLTKEFSLLIVIAAVVGCPLAYFLMNEWLTDFNYHIDLGFGTFLLSTILTWTFSLLAVSLQTFKAAFMNPINALRYE